jgi:hypothetical protein
MQNLNMLLATIPTHEPETKKKEEAKEVDGLGELADLIKG